MAVSVDIDALNQLIREGAPNALDMLAALPSPCVVDAEGQSPVNVAIEANNEEVFFLLVDADGALEFAPAVHSSGDARLIKTIYQTEGIDDIEDAERRALEAAGVPPYWQRTPLLQACRCQNRSAIQELIARGAKLTAKDLVGETPLSLCIRSGGSDLAQHFIESCVAAKKPVPLSEEVLRNLCGDAELYKQAIAHGRPNVTAKRFMFNLACATIDRSTIEKMLDDGFDLNSAITNSANPVVELVTSRLAWMYKASQWTELAAGYAHYNGHPDTTVVKISNNPGPGDLTYGQTLALHADLNESVRRKEPNPKFMSTESLQERLALLSLFFEKGLDVAKLKQKLNFPLTADVVSSNEPDFVATLIGAGFSLAPDGGMDIEHAIQHGYFDMVAPLKRYGHKLKNPNMVPVEMLEKYRQWQSSNGPSPPATRESPPRSVPKKKADISWELQGESVLIAEVAPDPPRAGKPCTIRLRHSNVYGPCPDVQFEMRANEDDWQLVELIRQTVDVDGEDIDIARLDETPFGEPPWVGIFETRVTLPKGKHQILIQVTTSDPDNCGTLEGWFVGVTD